MIELENLVTEKRNQNTYNLDQLSVAAALQLMNQEDHKVPDSVQQALPQIEAVVKAIIKAFKQGGRLIYIGAGTSGRLGILDAAECVPTFGISPDMVIGLIAGGEKAMTVAVEGAEDDASLGETDLAAIELSANDMVLGLTASGRTPYVIGALRYANKIGATTASLSCNFVSETSQYAQFPIEVDCGSEFLTGSTRLKAGSAQKMILNMISTLSMVGIGKVYKNLMVDVKATNEKLVARSKRIIMQATDVSYSIAERAFETANHDVKLAIVMILTDLPIDAAKARLQTANGFIREAIQ